MGYVLQWVTMDEHSTTHDRGYSPSKEQLLARLRRVEGQVRGISKMVEDDRYCIDVMTQISAVQAAMNKVSLGLMDGHVKHCVLDAEPRQRAERADELLTVVGRMLRAR